MCVRLLAGREPPVSCSATIACKVFPGFFGHMVHVPVLAVFFAWREKAGEVDVRMISRLILSCLEKRGCP